MSGWQVTAQQLLILMNKPSPTINRGKWKSLGLAMSLVLCLVGSTHPVVADTQVYLKGPHSARSHHTGCRRPLQLPECAVAQKQRGFVYGDSGG